MDVAVPVATLLKDYADNEIRADATYKSKRVRIVGKIGDIKRDITNSMYVTIGSGGPLEIPKAQCFFGDEHAQNLASFSQGMPTMVDCTVQGLMMNVLMKDCSFPSVATWNACNELVSAGIATECQLDTTDERTPFLTSRAVGIVTFLRTEAEYAKYTAAIDADPDAGNVLRNYVGSPTTRIVVHLPTASADTKRRIKEVIDRLQPRTTARSL